MTIIGVSLAVAIGLAVYLAVLAVIAVLSDSTLSWKQKVAQCAVAICVPIMGALTVLFMAYPVTPKLLRWVPWPFKNMISDKEIKRYSSREDQSGESDYGT